MDEKGLRQIRNLKFFFGFTLVPLLYSCLTTEIKYRKYRMKHDMKALKKT